MNELAVQCICYKLFFGDVAVAVLVDRCSGRIKILFRSRVMIIKLNIFGAEVWIIIMITSLDYDHQNSDHDYEHGS